MHTNEVAHEIINVENANNRYGYSILLRLTCTCGEKWTVRRSTYTEAGALRRHVSGYALAIAVDRAAVKAYMGGAA